MQRRIRKYLEAKKNPNKLFNRPPQTKSKNNYLFLNSADDNINNIENKNPNIVNNINDSETSPQKNEKEAETQDEMDDSMFYRYFE